MYILYIYTHIFIKTYDSVAPRYYGCFRDIHVNKSRPMRLCYGNLVE